MIFFGLFRHNHALDSEKMLVFGFIVWALTAACHGKILPLEETSSTHASSFGSVLTRVMDEPRRYVESIVGAHAIETFLAFIEMVLRLVAEGTASGLNVIAVYVSEILRVTGVGDPVSIPHFTPEGVFMATKWALIALIGYWLLCLLLRVAIALLKQVFWLLKMVMVTWLFVHIISDPNASPETTLMRLALLVFICAVVSVATRAAGGTNLQWMENCLKNLEGRVEVLEKMKRSND